MNILSIAVVFVLSLLYVWSLYNIPILVAGVKHMRKTTKKGTDMAKSSRQELPTVSIIVPVKDEEKVVGRLLKSLLKVNYPPKKKDIVVVEDGSTDKTDEICTQYAEQYPDQIRLIHQPTSNGKPSALNSALKHARGEIVAVFDSDNILEPDALLNAVEYFEDPSIAAVQGRPCSINANENMLSKFISYEETVRYETYIMGKDVLNLFVPLTGSCYFVRRSVLDNVGGWANSLSEDMELSTRLAEKSYNVRYASDVQSWQENPTNLGQLLRQRARWFRGCMETSLKYGKLLKRLDRRCIDAEVTLLAPFIFVPILLSYVFGIYTLVSSAELDAFPTVMAQGIMFLTLAPLFMIGVALFYMAKPRKRANLLWLPFVYAYWSIQSFIAVYALLQIVFRRPRVWQKTSKTGNSTCFTSL